MFVFGFVLLCFDPLFGEIFFREISEGTLRIFRGIFVFPRFIGLIIGSVDEVLELILT